LLTSRFVGLLALSFSAYADLQKDQQAIRAHAGCYNVAFDFAETFPLQPGYQVHSSYHEQAVELVILDQDIARQSENTILLQHILMTPDGPIKHWRQEWTYEPSYLFQFKGDLLWEKQSLSKKQSKGAWVQRVYQVERQFEHQWHSANTYGERKG
jgi:hypothetical protein